MHCDVSWLPFLSIFLDILRTFLGIPVADGLIACGEVTRKLYTGEYLRIRVQGDFDGWVHATYPEPTNIFII